MKKKRKMNYELLPLLFVIVLPLVMHVKEVETGLAHFPWFPSEMVKRADFFLYWKSRFLIVIAFLMLIILADAFFVREKRGFFSKKWLPLLIYELFAVVSMIFSVDRTVSMSGMMEHFETVWVLLGYGIAACYTYYALRQKKDFQIIQTALMVMLCIQIILGLFQLAGLDLLQTGIVKRFLLAGSGLDSQRELLFNFAGETYQRVYGTFYNPNYAGVYYAMMMPLLFSFFKSSHASNWRHSKLCLGGFVAADLLCIIGTGSKSAIVALAVFGVLLGIYEGRRERRRIWYVLLAAIGCVTIFFMYDFVSGSTTVGRFVRGFAIPEPEEKLQNITVMGNQVELQFSDRKLSFSYQEEGEALYPVFLDESGNPVEYVSEERTQTCTLEEKAFEGLTFQCYRKNEIPYIMLEYNGILWRFTDWTESGEYRYITIWGKPDTIEKAGSVLPARYEPLFTGRGYIWGRTIPLLKKYVFWGSGPDSFLLVFPQNDYVARANLGYGFFSEILTKPHNMYLQMALQTGVISALCFLVLLFRYMAESIRLYCLKNDGREKEADRKNRDFGFGIFATILLYAVMGLTNDSMLVTAPLFWLLLGMGMKWNHLQRADGDIP